MKGKTTFLTKAFLMLFAVLFSFTEARAQAKALPYEYGFENNDLAAEGWTMENCYASTGIFGNAKRTGNYGFRFYYRSNPPQYLISPEFEGTTAMTVSFWYRPASTQYPETFQVGYSTTTNATDDFTWEAEVTANTAEWIEYETTVPAGTKYVAIMLNSDDKYYLYLDDFLFEVPSSATKPETLEVSGITDSGAVLTWTGGNGTYNVEYKKVAETDWTVAATGTTEYTCTLSGLTSGTAYEARVQSVNGSDVSGWKTVSFSTVISFPYFQDFAAGLPADWTIYTGLVEEVLSGAATLTSTTSKWKVGTDNGVLDGNHALANIYGTGTQHWLVTPVIPVEADAQLAFNVAYTAYSGTAVAPNATGTDDKFVVLISTDDKATWTVLRQWDNAGSEFVLNDLGPTTTPVILDLSTYAGQTVYIAFYVESTESNADSNLHIDNISFEEKPAVETPYGLKISYTGGTEATISWTSAESAWDMDVNGTTTENVGNPATLTGLAFATTYNIKVRAKNANGVSDWSVPVSFSTDISDDMCQIKLVLLDSWGDGWNDGAAIQIADVASGIVIGTFKNDGSTGKDPQTIVVDVPNDRDIQFSWIAGGQYDSECSYTAYDINDEVIFSGSGAFTDPVTWHVSCAIVPWKTPSDLAASEITATSAKLSWTENSTTPATSWVVAYKEATETDFGEETATENPYVLEGLTPETKYIVKVRPETNEVEKWSEEISFTTLEKYPKPTGLAASDITPTSATVTWTANADSYEVRYGLLPAGSTSSALLQYDDDTYVTSIGSSSASTWTWGVMYPGSMVTDNTLTKVSIFETSNNTEDITINVYQGGDTAPGTLLYTETVSTEAADAFHEITLASPVALTPGENLWITLTETGTYVLAACDTTEPNNQWVESGGWYNIGDLASSLAGYGWMIRANIESSNFNPDAITWTTVSDITENTYNLTGFDPLTDYIVQVRSTYSDGESAWATTTFTTLSACTAPSELAISDIKSDGATLTWKGFQDAYNVKVTKPADIDISKFEQVGSDITATSTSTEYTFDLSAYSGTGAIAIRHYNVSDMFMLNIDDINLTDAGGTTILTEDFQSAALPTNWVNYDADGDGYVWSLRTFYDSNNNPTGEYCATSASWVQSGALNPDNWFIIPNVELGGTLTFNAFGQDPDYPEEVFAVLVCEGDFMSPEESQTFANVTSPYVIAGLNPETKYEVQVQGISEVCGGFTDWSEAVTFTTMPENTVPFNIQADLAANAATLTWDGNGDSYEVKYMPLEMNEKFFYDDFEDGISSWTNIKNGEGPGSNGWYAMNIGENTNPFYAAVSYSWYEGTAYAADNWLITPAIELDGTLEFIAIAPYGDEYEVLLSTTGNDIADFTTTLQAMAPVNASNGDYNSIDLSAYAGQKGYIAIHHVFTDGFYLAIGDFGLYGTGKVDAGTVQSVTTTEKTATLTGLETNRIYGVVVNSVKGENTSDWSDEFDFALLTLDSDADNRSLINNANGMQAHVTLANRTLYADNTWNTLAVPFDLDPTELNASPLAGADIRTLMNITVDGSSVTMNFTPVGYFDSYGLWGGYPLIMKWATGSDIVNPEFANVTILSDYWNYGYSDPNSGYAVNFTPTYQKKSFSADDPSILFVGANNKLNYPLAGASVGACRAYFELKGFTMEDGNGVKIFTDLDDLDDATGIATIENRVDSGDWYDLSGRKLAGKPSMKGIYLNGGRKVTVK